MSRSEPTETWSEKRSRLAMMASGDQKWDLSPRDIDALCTALDRITKMEVLIGAVRLYWSSTDHGPRAVLEALAQLDEGDRHE